ncbi:Hypothetical protein SRAE_1000128100 [Strongyloides ratti]|uniref:Uncharacterized protein n=1 Tax=Strongyloides ratti TaxID=34506 RepID=A0A090KZQ6_STRRB|nr:Hypothetical protein SRAE_1000128100 [Strongyloides ratti]CEF63015.1 Hypothetical protein SRAE_1000128100 [Strongyloides ratti]
MSSTIPPLPHPVRGSLKLPLSVKEFENINNPETILSLIEMVKLEEIKKFINCSDELGKIIQKDIKRRWEISEQRAKDIEAYLEVNKPDQNTIEDDRFDIFCDLLDKACQAFEIYDEHESREIASGKRLYLECELLEIINKSFDTIYKKMQTLDEFKDDRDGAFNERDIIRIDIRSLDVQYSLIHERFLKAFLEMEW